jgi:hypothetical protein
VPIVDWIDTFYKNCWQSRDRLVTSFLDSNSELHGQCRVSRSFDATVGHNLKLV